MKDHETQQLFDLIHSNSKLSNLLSEFGIFAVNYNDGRVLANDLFKKWGYSEMDMSLDHDWADNIHPEDKARVLVAWQNIIEKRIKDTFCTSYRYRKKDGSYAWLVSKGKYISYINNNGPGILFGSEYEITEQKQSEIELSEALARAEKIAKESDALLRIGATISSSLELHETAKIILKEIKNLVNYDTGMVCLLKEHRLEVICAYDTAKDELLNELTGKLICLEDESSFYSVITTYKKSLICSDVDSKSQLFKSNQVIKNIQSTIGIPLVSKNKIVGILQLCRTQQGAFNIDEYDTINKFSDNISIAIDNAALHEKFSQMALTDPLTKVGNRHGLNTQWESIAGQIINLYQQFSCMIIDIDNLKQINDQFGHAMGDKVIKLVALSIHKMTRNNDIVARYGGDEYVVILPDADHQKAALVAEKIRNEVNKNKLDLDGKKASISVSIGIHCAALSDIRSLEQFVKAADIELYKAKSNGKNCLCSSQQNTTKD